MNGQSIVDLSHDNIVQLIKDAGVTVTLTVVAEEGEDKATLPQVDVSVCYCSVAVNRHHDQAVYKSFQGLVHDHNGGERSARQAGRHGSIAEGLHMTIKLQAERQ